MPRDFRANQKSFDKYVWNIQLGATMPHKWQICTSFQQRSSSAIYARNRRNTRRRKLRLSSYVLTLFSTWLVQASLKDNYDSSLHQISSHTMTLANRNLSRFPQQWLFNPPRLICHRRQVPHALGLIFWYLELVRSGNDRQVKDDWIFRNIDQKCDLESTCNTWWW